MKIGDVQLESNLLLAPIAGYCDLPFRLLVRSVPGIQKPDGTRFPTVGLACTDLLCSEAILRETQTTKWLAATSPEDRPVAMQLYGRHPESLAPAGAWAANQGACIVDVNMGCPVDKVTKRNGGSKLLTEPCLAVDIIQALVRTLEPMGVPVTAKIRLGWDEDCLITDTLPVALADVGVQAVTVHGRTTAMKFRGECRLDGIAQVVESVKAKHPHVTVIGNGDVTEPEHAQRMIDVTGCDGVMIGRGALGQPWLFRDTAYYLATGQRPEPLTRAEKARLVLQHLDLLLHFRDEPYAVMKIHQRVSWYSKHLQPWSGLRRTVRSIREASELRDYLAAGVEKIEQEDGMVSAV